MWSKIFKYSQTANVNWFSKDSLTMFPDTSLKNYCLTTSTILQNLSRSLRISQSSLCEFQRFCLFHSQWRIQNPVEER